MNLRGIARKAFASVVCAVYVGAGASARAQTPSVAGAPPTPSPTAAAPASTPATTTPREAALEERLRRLESLMSSMERKHALEYSALEKKYESLKGQVDAAKAGAPASRPIVRPVAAQVGGDIGSQEGIGAQGTGGRTRADDEGPGIGERDFTSGAEAPGGAGARAEGGIGAQGTEGRTFIREADAKPSRVPARVDFAEGIEFRSSDDEFELAFHNLTQAEYRGFPTSQQGTLKSQFFIPRQRWYFTGRATKNIEFYTVINRGYGSLDLLDAFMTIAYDERLRLRAGRMKTPFNYEYYSIAEGDLIAPERSLYSGNLSGNREDGLMLLGELFKGRLGYAGGIFNGPRRSFQDFNSDKDLYLYVNTRPFLRSEELPFLKYLNIGGTVNGGMQKNPAQPDSFHTANDQSTPVSEATLDGLSPTILQFNNNVTELGPRLAYGAHIAYYYKSLMLLAMYGNGFQDYSNNGRTSTRVGQEGWMVQGTYFLTGEQVTRRVNMVKPVHDFSIRKGKRGLGAIEVHARLSELNLGRDVFTGGLADPNLWTNQAYAIDVGANWYLNFYTKVYLDWQHAIYGNPVFGGGTPERYLGTTDLFWLRFQLFF